MSVQDKINDNVVRTDGEKNDRLYVRINSVFKEKLLEKARKQEKSLSTYVLDILRTFEGSKGPASDNDVRTDDYIKDKIKKLEIEHQILLKLIESFAQQGIEVDLDNNEIEVVKKLAEEVFHA